MWMRHTGLKDGAAAGSSHWAKSEWVGVCVAGI